MNNLTLDEAIDSLFAMHQDLTKRGDVKPEEWKKLESQYNSLLNRNPDNPRILFQLGTYHMQTGNAGLAIPLIERAVTFGAGGGGPYLNIAAAYKIEHKDDRALEYYKKALANSDNGVIDERGINMDKVFALHGIGSLYVNAGDPATCIHWCNKALAIDPDDRHAMWNKGLALLEQGQFAEGFKIYDEAGFKDSGAHPIERKLKTYGGLPRWNGEKGQTVVCYGEQGVGDEIMFASIIPDLMRDCKVIIDCDKRIEKMLKRSFSELEAVYPTSDIDAPFPWKADHKIDAYVPMGSLGKYYRNKKTDFPKTPYLKADPEKKAKWRAELDKLPANLNVGISWVGGLKKTRMDMRSIPLYLWRDVLKVPGINFHSLQYHKFAADESADMGNQIGAPIYHWQDMIDDYEETAGFLENLDLVITVNTSLHHLAGALGVKQWCLTPTYCAWRYGVTGPSPWYNNCTMKRQKKSGDWDRVLKDVTADLAAFAGMKAAA